MLEEAISHQKCALHFVAIFCPEDNILCLFCLQIIGGFTHAGIWHEIAKPKQRHCLSYQYSLAMGHLFVITNKTKEINLMVPNTRQQ